MKERETWILKQFIRRAHLFVTAPPAIENWIEWLGLLQHHGGPTRLLDFTRSFYVAAYFAIEDAQSDAAVWGIRWMDLYMHFARKYLNAESQPGAAGILATKGPEMMHDKADQILKQDEDGLGALYLQPLRLQQRIVSQQAVFLMPTSLKWNFLENLTAALTLTGDSPEQLDFARGTETELFVQALKRPLVKVVIPKSTFKSALHDLSDMNITHASLFPDLDGFARSLRANVRVYEEGKILE